MSLLFGHNHSNSAEQRPCFHPTQLSPNRTSTIMTTTNPILAGGLPAFSQILPDHALPAVEHCLENCRRVIKRIEAPGADASYENVLEAEQLADNALGNAWSTISHLHSVNITDKWRHVY